LTIDKITLSPVKNLLTQKMESEKSYSFKLPNFELSNSYCKDCFNGIFDLKNNEELLAENGKEIKKAFIERNADVISEILSGFFKTISYHQRPNDEKTFLSLTQILLGSMGIKPLSEISNYKGRLDLCLKIEDKLYVVVELKYCTYKKELIKKEENKILANSAKSIIAPKEYKQILVRTLVNKLSTIEMLKILIEASDKNELSKDEEDKVLLKEDLNTLKEEEINNALADTIRTKLPDEEVQETILKNFSSFDLTEEQIDDKLSKAVEQALQDIKNRDYHSTINAQKSKIFGLGLAIFGAGEKIKAKFAP
jgi:hypothetical protein